MGEKQCGQGWSVHSDTLALSLGNTKRGSWATALQERAGCSSNSNRIQEVNGKRLGAAKSGNCHFFPGTVGQSSRGTAK